MRTQNHPSSAYQKFVSSMETGYEDWHDGVGYDVDALKQITGPEQTAAIKILAEHLGREHRNAPDHPDALKNLVLD